MVHHRSTSNTTQNTNRLAIRNHSNSVTRSLAGRNKRNVRLRIAIDADRNTLAMVYSIGGG